MSFRKAIDADCVEVSKALERIPPQRQMLPRMALQRLHVEALKPLAALHASAPAGHKCADCTIDAEACPACYEAAWRKNHPHYKAKGPAFIGACVFFDGCKSKTDCNNAQRCLQMPSPTPVAWKVQIGRYGTPSFADEWWQVEFRIKGEKDAKVTPLYALPIPAPQDQSTRCVCGYPDTPCTTTGMVNGSCLGARAIAREIESEGKR